MFTQGLALRSTPWPGPEQIADVRLAASKMTGATQRAFEAEMTMKYCGGNARQAESAGYNGFCGSCSTPFIEPQTSKFSSQLLA